MILYMKFYWSAALVYAFNVRVTPAAAARATAQGVAVHQFRVIYALFEELRKTLEARLPPVNEERVLGEALVLATFKPSDGVGQIAGCRCVRGEMIKNKLFRVVREPAAAHPSAPTPAAAAPKNPATQSSAPDRSRVEPLASGLKCSTMKRVKADADSIRLQEEFGIRLDNFTHNFEPNRDKIQCYEVVQKPGKLEWQHGC